MDDNDDGQMYYEPEKTLAQQLNMLEEIQDKISNNLDQDAQKLLLQFNKDVVEIYALL